MKRMEASRRNANALSVRFSKTLDALNIKTVDFVTHDIGDMVGYASAGERWRLG
jgi:hypothetical protein